MFELRWLVKTREVCLSVYARVTRTEQYKVLQYRAQYMAEAKGESFVWTEWRDVPSVIEAIKEETE